MIHDIGLLLARLTVGASIAAHGAQKAFGSFGGPGPAGAAGFMESLGFSPGGRYAAAASASELAAGTLIALGAGGPVGPGILLSTMVVAQTSVHAKNGYFAQQGGIELGVLYATAAVALVSSGYGRFSVDEAFGWDSLRAKWLTAGALAGGVAVGIAILAQRNSTGDEPAGLDTASDATSAESETSAAPGAAHSA